MDYFYIIVIITILIFGYLFFKIRKFKNQNVVKMLFPEYTFVLKDGDVDRTKSLLSSVTFADDGAFSKSSEFCELIENVPESEVIHLVIHTNGGDGVHCERMLRKLKKHQSGYIAYVKSPCYSAGSMIALGAKEIVFYKDSSLGKIDPQIGKDQAMVYYTADKRFKSHSNIHKFEQAQYLFNYEMELLDILFPNNSTQKIVRENVIENMLLSKLPHFKAFGLEECRQMGLPARYARENEYIYFTHKGMIKNYKFV